MTRMNLAARAGAWSAGHRKQAIFGWLAFVLIAAVVGAGVLGTNTDSHDGSGQSGRVDSFLRQHFPQSSTETILIQARHGTLANSSDYRAALHTVTAGVARVPHVFDIVAPGRARRRLRRRALGAREPPARAVRERRPGAREYRRGSARVPTAADRRVR